MSVWRTALAAAAAVAAVALTTGTGAAAAAPLACPSGGTPPPGTTVYGGLVVDGTCNLTGVDVKGALTVAPSGEVPFSDLKNVTLDGSTVEGGVVVGQRSWISLGLNEFTGAVLSPSTVKGGITLTQPLWIDAEFAHISGGIRADDGFASAAFLCGPIANGCFAAATFCGDIIDGALSFGDTRSIQLIIGDPGEIFFPTGQECASNTINGSITLANSNFTRPTDGEPGEIEGNAVSGSIRVDASTAEIYGNTVGGSLLCTNGTVIHPPPPGDPSGTTNTARGQNTCV